MDDQKTDELLAAKEDDVISEDGYYAGVKDNDDDCAMAVIEMTPPRGVLNGPTTSNAKVGAKDEAVGTIEGCYEEETDEESDDESTENEREDRSMLLEGQERSWALELKQLVEASDTLTNLSDMEYVQFAIVAEGNMPLALQKIEGVQTFRETYRIDGTPDQGMHYLEELVRLQPGFLLHIDICPITGEGITAWDEGSFDPAIAFQIAPGSMEERNWRIHAGATYYLFQALAPSIQSIREGIFFLLDAADAGWHNLNVNFEHRMQAEIGSCYPIPVKCMMEYNSNSVATIFWGLMKSILPKEITAVLELGCQVESHDSVSAPVRTLTELYMQPSPQEATYHMLRRARELLALRAANEAAFRLS